MKAFHPNRLAILLLVCLIFSIVLTACGGDETTTQPSQTAGNSTTTAGTASANATTQASSTTTQASQTSGPAGTVATATTPAGNIVPDPSQPGLVAAPTQALPAGPGGPDSLYVGETGHFIKKPFLTYWQDRGGKAVFGNPLSEVYTRNGLQTQLFEQALLEYHPELAGKTGEFQLAFLGREVAQAQKLLPNDPAFAPVAAKPNTATESFFPETKHTMVSPFKDFWESNGLLKFLGYPISQSMQQGGLTVQYFERGRLEINPTTKKVAYSNSGDLLMAAAGWPQPQKFDLRLNLPDSEATSQGKAFEIQLASEDGWLPGDLQGKFATYGLKFGRVKAGSDVFRTYQAVDPALAPQTYPLTLTFTDKQGLARTISRQIKVAAHDYGAQDLTLSGSNDSLADHSADEYDDGKLAQAYATFSPALLWQGVWQWPLKVAWSQTTDFAQRRVYNGKLDTLYYHGGIDMAPDSGVPGANAYTAAPGKVIFTGELQARGNTVVVDHGLGITSYYFHLSQINVQVGQMLENGAVVGLVGSTGRSTGAHLHWEVRVNGIITDPRNFLNQDFSQ